MLRNSVDTFTSVNVMAYNYTFVVSKIHFCMFQQHLLSTFFAGFSLISLSFNAVKCPAKSVLTMKDAQEQIAPG